MEKMCNYCANILYHNADYPQECWDKVIYETKNFVVTPTVGALIEGWVLIISKRHVTAMGALTKDELYELKELTIKIKNLVVSTYGAAVVFEHGPACEGTTFGCGIDHAHFHVVPLQIPLAQLIEEELRSTNMWEIIADIRELLGIHRRKASYLYILENGENQGRVACLDEVPSQFMRRVIASFLGIPHLYDYRKYKFHENAMATLCRLQAALSNESPCLVGVA